MVVQKTKLDPKIHGGDPSISEDFNNQKTEVPLDPTALLEDLKAKQTLYQTLKEEGLIHQDKHKGMEARLKTTIQELEILIPQLEVLKS